MNDPSTLTPTIAFIVVATLAAVVAAATIAYLAVESYGTTRSARAAAGRADARTSAYLTLQLDGQE
jgi:hypothetical protein